MEKWSSRPGSLKSTKGSSESAKGPVPAVNLARLAVDVSQQGHGLGGDLVVDALRRIQRFADEVGIRAVTVDALDDRASQFYLKFGFEPLLDNRLHLFLPMSTIRKLSL